jgi:hypothetical protein
LNLPSIAEQFLLTHWSEFQQSHENYVVQNVKSPAVKAQYYFNRGLLETVIRIIYNQYIRFNPNATPKIRASVSVADEQLSGCLETAVWASGLAK